ncbi:MAG TPA: lactonase family protein [Vicinamibacteria bacterium]|nr:lactonase family protein [Vicinamibacteria bacterium]
MKGDRAVAGTVLAAGLLGALPSPASDAGSFVYFGTYTNGPSKGIYVSRFDPATGIVGAPALAAESVNPSFLAVHPTGRFLYAVNEVGDFEGAPAGAASAFAIEPTGKLRPLNQASTRGPGPCYASVDRAGKHLLVANYGGGSVAVLPIAADGRLGAASAFVQHETLGAAGEKPRRPHGHSIDLEPTGRFALVADLGLDRVYVYRLTPEGALVPGDPPFAALDAGSGPRHVAIHPAGGFVYVLNEKAMTLDAFSLDAATGRLEHRQKVSSLPEGVAVAPGFSGAEVLVHPSGRFVYASNRGHDTIAAFAIDQGQGTVKPVGHTAMGGRTPRGFGIDPSGRWLIAGNQRSDTVSVFRIDASTGRLADTGQTVALGAPVSVVFVAAPAAGAR